ncbi:uncharacterized protein LOC143346466 [Colletes latitarsis]|uniref:uncharacterized protein LOC143346466 n=1 Tax=Colletes latitarsis TaxID=2605962 RepID=UPI004035EDD9
MWILYVALVASCGSVIAFPQHDSFYGVDDFVFNEPITRPSHVTYAPVTPTTVATTTTSENSDAAFQACVNSCPTTSEYNPICGTDNVVYSNPGSLGCTVQCGKDIKLKYYGTCGGADRG